MTGFKCLKPSRRFLDWWASVAPDQKPPPELAVEYEPMSLVEIARDARERREADRGLEDGIRRAIVDGLEQLSTIAPLVFFPDCFPGRDTVIHVRLGNEARYEFVVVGMYIRVFGPTGFHKFSTPREALEWFAREHAAHFIDEGK